MKKITFLAAFFVAFAMNSQTTLWEDDFESYTPGDNVGEDIDVPAGYLNYDVDGDGFGWGLSNPVNFTQPMGDIYVGNFLMSASFITTGAGGNGGNGALSPNNILVTPAISIPGGAGDVDLTYFVGSGTDTTFFNETYSVTVTTSDAEVDILAATPILTTTLAFQGGEEVTLDMDGFAGQDVYVAFRHHDTTDEWLIGLDFIRVTAGVLGVDDNNLGSLTYAVNGDILTLKNSFPLENVQIFNVLGQQVLSQKLSVAFESIDISSLNSGIYLVNIAAEGQSRTVKIVKR